VYKSAYVMPDDGEHCFDVPEIDVDDMPMVTVYVSTPSVPDVWFEIPLYYQGTEYFGMFCTYFDGGLCVYECGGFYIMAVVVI
ncbi:MAG: hypothetical protein GWN67_00015, partial [Phycisphaerae bacterium]|nr:hypothetical protein [candidate division Zixibacteria bacterium]NIU54832.1 hypothetical protein [Phycisphaerae bacterium]NIW91319.1 hypothetical protein [Phycisphaerae bacterium]